MEGDRPPPPPSSSPPRKRARLNPPEPARSQDGDSESSQTGGLDEMRVPSSGLAAIANSVISRFPMRSHVYEPPHSLQALLAHNRTDCPTLLSYLPSFQPTSTQFATLQPPPLPSNEDGMEADAGTAEVEEQEAASTFLPPALREASLAVEDPNTDEEDLQQLSMVIQDTSNGSDRVPFVPVLGASELNYDDVRNMVFIAAREQKEMLLDRILRLVKRAENGEDLMRALVEAEDDTGLTLLMISVRNNMVGFCRALLQEGAVVNYSNEKRSCALLLAAQKGACELTRLLLEYGASTDSSNMALIPAAHFGHLEVVKLLVEFGADQNYANKKGTTPLMRAAQEGRDAVVKFLLQKGADGRAANNEGMTALMLAAQRGHAGIARLLIEAGSDVNKQTRQGSTALLLAAKRGHSAAVEALLTAGADIFLRDDRDKTAADTAQRRGHLDLFLKISVTYQLRLMREDMRNQRFDDILRLAHLFTLGRARFVPAFQLPQQRPYRELFERTFLLPRPLLENVALFLPACHLWEHQLRYLVHETPYRPSSVVQQGIRMMDEIVWNASLEAVSSLHTFRPSDPHCSGHLTLMRDNASFRHIFVTHCNPPLTTKMLGQLRRMADIQGTILLYSSGIAVQFGTEVAQDVVALLTELLNWDDARKQPRLSPAADDLAPLLSP